MIYNIKCTKDSEGIHLISKHLNLQKKRVCEQHIRFFLVNDMDEAKRFYKSKAWQKCRASYIASVGGLCERCRNRGIIKPGYIVHHRRYIDPETVTDPEVLMSFDNLEYLCFDCHNKEHFSPKKRYSVRADGTIIPEG